MFWLDFNNKQIWNIMTTLGNYTKIVAWLVFSKVFFGLFLVFLMFGILIVCFQIYGHLSDLKAPYKILSY